MIEIFIPMFIINLLNFIHEHIRFIEKKNIIIKNGGNKISHDVKNKFTCNYLLISLLQCFPQIYKY